MLAVREKNCGFSILKTVWDDPWTAALSTSQAAPPQKERFSGRCDDVVDGNDIVAEIQGGAITTTYLRGLNIDEPFVRQSSGGNEYYHTDALGSTLALTNDTGAVTTRYSYDPFGKTTVTGTSNNAFQYSGRENDGTGLYYYRARYYSPMMQRFISPDPSGSAMRPPLFVGNTILLANNSCNPLVISDPDRLQYLYVKDNPINLTDPSGLAGTQACDYYDRQCDKSKKSGGGSGGYDKYACKAGKCCRDFGEGPKKDCIRECLIKEDYFCSRISDEESRRESIHFLVEICI